MFLQYCELIASIPFHDLVNTLVPMVDALVLLDDEPWVIRSLTIVESS
jgi:hypothetical protein